MNKPKTKLEPKSQLKFKCKNGNYGVWGLLERFVFKITSGRFIFSIVVAGVYAYMACTGLLEENRVQEITLIVLYAYFNRPRLEQVKSAAEDEPIK